MDASSHDGDPLSSSLEDLASASNQSHTSRGTSRSVSAENLLDEVGSENCSSRNEEKILSSSEGCGSENLSAAAVVCLTEKIHRMQESQISTNEELEATVQVLEVFLSWSFIYFFFLFKILLFHSNSETF